jgi:hypothetical protein
MQYVLFALIFAAIVLAKDDGFDYEPETKSWDYVVVGAGASGMSFVDSLLKHTQKPITVAILDKRDHPGGHWNDGYGFVKLHQSARNYGVESTKLEMSVVHPEGLASRSEMIEYYQNVLAGWKTKGHKVEFIGGAEYNFVKGSYSSADGTSTTLKASKKVVDARYTENDLPLHVPPKFAYNENIIDLIPPHTLSTQSAADRYYVVLGAGKTGQDTMLYLRQTLNIPTDRIVWVMPSAPWITCRDPPSGQNHNTCMPFIGVCLEAHAEAGAPANAADGPDFLQRGFEKLEKLGNLYRIDPSTAPTKFMDATLNKHEVAVLQGCSQSIASGRGRVSAIADDGSLNFEDGSTFKLPWAAEAGAAAATTFVHCTAGAFNFGSSAKEAHRPVFSSDTEIRVQEVFQFPGFCFNGAVIGWLESKSDMTIEQKNALCELPPAGDPEAPDDTPSALGPVAGGVGALGAGHPLLVSHRNLRRWYGVPGMGEWLHSLRLFSLKMNGYSLEEGKALVEKNHAGLVAAGILPE